MKRKYLLSRLTSSSLSRSSDWAAVSSSCSRPNSRLSTARKEEKPGIEGRWRKVKNIGYGGQIFFNAGATKTRTLKFKIRIFWVQSIQKGNEENQGQKKLFSGDFSGSKICFNLDQGTYPKVSRLKKIMRNFFLFLWTSKTLNVKMLVQLEQKFNLRNVKQTNLISDKRHNWRQPTNV